MATLRTHFTMTLEMLETFRQQCDSNPGRFRAFIEQWWAAGACNIASTQPEVIQTLRRIANATPKPGPGVHVQDSEFFKKFLENNVLPLSTRSGNLLDIEKWEDELRYHKTWICRSGPELCRYIEVTLEPGLLNTASNVYVADSYFWSETNSEGRNAFLAMLAKNRVSILHVIHITNRDGVSEQETMVAQKSARAMYPQIKFRCIDKPRAKLHDRIYLVTPNPGSPRDYLFKLAIAVGPGIAAFAPASKYPSTVSTLDRPEVGDLWQTLRGNVSFTES